MSNRYKLTIEYDGSPYCGFQKQSEKHVKSIAEILEKAIFNLTKEEVKISVCGRTDAGVHALGQVIHFDLKKEFNAFKMIAGLNHFLKNELIAVLDCEKLDEKFHARISAKMRKYRYIIINRRGNLTIDRNHAYLVVAKLDVTLMQVAAQFLIGKHDFSSFRDSQCQAKSPIRTIKSIEIWQEREKIFLEISAKSFLHHMVRNIVGTLILVGKKKIKPDEVKNILEAKNRLKSGPNAPSCGLYFVSCTY